MCVRVYVDSSERYRNREKGRNKKNKLKVSHMDDYDYENRMTYNTSIKVILSQECLFRVFLLLNRIDRAWVENIRDFTSNRVLCVVYKINKNIPAGFSTTDCIYDLKKITVAQWKVHEIFQKYRILLHSVVYCWV